MPRKKVKRPFDDIPLLAGGRRKRGTVKSAQERGALGGRPAHVPTEALRNLAKICSALNKTQGVTAELMGISIDTLTRHYQAELKSGKDTVNVAIVGKIVSAATSPNHTGATVEAAKFWLKTQLGWKEPSVLEVDAKVRVEEADPLELISSRIAGYRERIGDPSDPKRAH